MNNVKTYEAFWGDVGRTLNPERLKHDNEAIELFDEIKEDFEANYTDLRKVKIIDHGGNKIDFHQIKVGKQFNLIYVFGKWHPTRRDPMGTTTTRSIKISSIPFFITLQKNQLEKMFNTDRINMSKVRVEDEEVLPNYDGTDNRRKTKNKEYRISYDVANDIYNYFNKAFKTYYPDLDKSEYKGSGGISDIKKDIPPLLKYIDVKNIMGEEITFPIRKGDNEKFLRSVIVQMGKEEAEAYSKIRNKNLYKEDTKNKKEFKENWAKKIDGYLKKNDINLESNITEWEPYGFRLQAHHHELRLEFRTEDPDIEEKVENFIDEEFDTFYVEKDNIREYDGWSYVMLIFENDEL